MSKNLVYAGIGSRKTPSNVLGIMNTLAQKLGAMGYILRSGGAFGADRAFERGADEGGYPKQVFYEKDCTPEAMEIAKSYHPSWGSVSEYGRRLHGRNAFQILGEGLDSPVDFVVCWTPDGCTKHKDRSIKTGGTGTAISIASERGIPVYNLQVVSEEEVIAYAKKLIKESYNVAT